MLSRRLFLAASTSAIAAPRLPNIVIILCDDLGYGDLGCYGSRIRTPNIDRLATQGIRFTDFYSGNPVCSPSRAALLTGRYCVRAGVPKVLFPYDEKGLPESESTIAQTLKPQGYRTMCIGKWHLGHQPPYLPTTRGFDHYFGIPYSNDMNPRWLMEDTKVIEEQATLETLTPRYTERAVGFIEESAKAGAPFFLYMPHTYPHIPLGASPKFRSKSPLGIYGDVVEELDWSVGEVLAALKRAGAESSTLVVFTSDNGPWYQGSAGPLRGRKGGTWEGGQRVPFIARFPGRIPRGKVSHAVAGVMDLHPTIAKLTGASPRNPFDGVDIMPLLTAAKPALDRDAFLYFDDVYLQCARLGKWKLHIARHNVMIYNPVPQAGRVSLPLFKPELYDLTADPSESYDVAAENPQVVADIQSRIDRLIATMPGPIRQAHADQMARKATAPPAGALPRPATN